jgi:histidinol dehydrogenase
MKVKVRTLSRMADGELQALLRRAETDIQSVQPVVERLIREVREQGDAAVLEHLRTIDRVELARESLRVSEAEFAAARAQVSPEVRQAVEHAIANVGKFHRAQMPERVKWVEIEPGVRAGEKITAIESVGLYVPRGKGSFPSVMIMLAVPAVIAGVRNIVICTPPNPDGTVDAASLLAAELIGAKTIYKIGGATAIAAMALGTESVPAVAKILGPGNQYCSAAKRLLYSTVDVGLPAGPSESIILADEAADPRKAALDLCNEAEHGPDSAALLVTHSRELADKVVALLPGLVSSLPEPRRTFCTAVFENYGGVVLTESLEESIDFANRYATEHMVLMTRDPEKVLEKIEHTGEVLLGENTPIAVGNYCLGVNAILPTGRFARSFSCTSLDSFLKKVSLAHCTKEGFERLRKTTAVLAEYEGFPAHARAARDR